VTSSASPTVRRRRLAAELRRLRGSHTGTTVAKALGWSPAKVSRYELGQGTFPLEEIEKLLDYYGVIEPRRAQLLALAAEANEPAWWYDYADALSPEYLEFIGLEAEAASELVWQVTAIPGLLQTEEYARVIHTAHQQVVLDPPGLFERRTAVRMIRQQVLTSRNPPLELSAVIDEAVLLRKVGSEEVMLQQLLHLAEVSRLPNVVLRILPLDSEMSLMADSFLVFGFSPDDESGKLGDVVSTEGVTDELRIEGESDTYMFRLIFNAFANAALSAEASRELILGKARFWRDGTHFRDRLSSGTRSVASKKPPEEDVVRGHDVSDDADGSVRTWRRSSRSYGSGNCLEVMAPHGARIDVRDSKNPDGAVLRFASAEWSAFVAGVRSGGLGL